MIPALELRLSHSLGNVDDDKEIDEIYTLLTENYVEDDVTWQHKCAEAEYPQELLEIPCMSKLRTLH